MATQAEKFQEIANAIRTKSHRTSPIIANNFAAEITSIPQNTKRVNNPFTPPELGTQNLDNAYEALKAAISYWNAKSSGTETFEYINGHGPLKGVTHADLHDSNGNAVVDCSTYVGLVLRGMGYLDSPYYNSSETTIDPRTVVATDATWAEEYFDVQEKRYTGSLVFPTYAFKAADGRFRVITTSDIALYYDKLGLFWFADDDTLTPSPGDICFFARETDDGSLTFPTRFYGISHVGFMTDKDHYINATDYPSSGDLVRTDAAKRPPFAYARPYYGALTDGSTDTLTVNKVDLIPDVLAGIPQGSSTTSGVTFSVTGKAITLSGTSSGEMKKTIISSSCPLYLPAGTYKLSGFVNESGTNTESATHSMWGFRVYNSETGEGITGTTTSNDGANTAERTPVWDVGAGAVFTLSEATPVHINLYLPGSCDCSTLSGTPALYRIS